MVLATKRPIAVDGPIRTPVSSTSAPSFHSVTSAQIQMFYQYNLHIPLQSASPFSSKRSLTVPWAASNTDDSHSEENIDDDEDNRGLAGGFTKDDWDIG